MGNCFKSCFQKTYDRTNHCRVRRPCNCNSIRHDCLLLERFICFFLTLFLIIFAFIAYGPQILLITSLSTFYSFLILLMYILFIFQHYDIGADCGGILSIVFFQMNLPGAIAASISFWAAVILNYFVYRQDSEYVFVLIDSSTALTLQILLTVSPLIMLLIQHYYNSLTFELKHIWFGLIPISIVFIVNIVLSLTNNSNYWVNFNLAQGWIWLIFEFFVYVGSYLCLQKIGRKEIGKSLLSNSQNTTKIRFTNTHNSHQSNLTSIKNSDNLNQLQQHNPRQIFESRRSEQATFNREESYQ